MNNFFDFNFKKGLDSWNSTKKSVKLKSLMVEKFHKLDKCEKVDVRQFRNARIFEYESWQHFVSVLFVGSDVFLTFVSNMYAVQQYARNTEHEKKEDAFLKFILFLNMKKNIIKIYTFFPPLSS